MYNGKKDILRKEHYEKVRAIVISNRSGAIFNTFAELDGLINKSALAEQYFNRSQAWFSQRLNGSTVGDIKREFSPDEARQLADAFRHIATRLNAHADEIDAVANID